MRPPRVPAHIGSGGQRRLVSRSLCSLRVDDEGR